MNATPRQLAIVTGASTGIGLELARLCAQQGWDLIIAADEPLIENAARELSGMGITCTAVECDLSTAEGVANLTSAIRAAGQFRAPGGEALRNIDAQLIGIASDGPRSAAEHAQPAVIGELLDVKGHLAHMAAG